MPKINEVYPSKWLTAADLDEADLTATITEATVEEMPDGSKKLVVQFEEIDKGFTCNLTNSKTIAAMYGNDTDDWVGKRITLFPTQVDFGGKMVDAIRVRPRIPRERPRAASAPAATPKPRHVTPPREPGDDDIDANKDIPF